MKIVRDMNVFDYINTIKEKPEKVHYGFETLQRKYQTSSGPSTILNLIMLGNEYDDELIIPDYQRDLVWTLKQKQDLILSILFGNPIGDFIFKKVKYKGSTTHIIWSVIDGQQRMNAIKGFVTNEFNLPDGRKFEDLEYWDIREFIDGYQLQSYVVGDISKEAELELYFKRNFGGTAHSLEDLKRFYEIDLKIKDTYGQ
jgi:uncharacterized protein with ParB-like and HNH nuclease domain